MGKCVYHVFIYVLININTYKYLCVNSPARSSPVHEKGQNLDLSFCPCGHISHWPFCTLFLPVHACCIQWTSKLPNGYQKMNNTLYNMVVSQVCDFCQKYIYTTVRVKQIIRFFFFFNYLHSTVFESDNRKYIKWC